MRISILPEEMKSREHLMFIGKKRMPEWQRITTNREPVPLVTPVHFDGKYYTVIVPYSFAPTETSKYRLKFIPIWARCYKVCHFRSTTIKALVVDFGDKQLVFDDGLTHPGNFTLTGDGVGEQAVHEAELELGKAMYDQPDASAVRGVVAYLKELAGQLAVAA